MVVPALLVVRVLVDTVVFVDGSGGRVVSEVMIVVGVEVGVRVVFKVRVTIGVRVVTVVVFVTEVRVVSEVTVAAGAGTANTFMIREAAARIVNKGVANFMVILQKR
jgi:hypothetical protein